MRSQLNRAIEPRNTRAPHAPYHINTWKIAVCVANAAGTAMHTYSAVVPFILISEVDSVTRSDVATFYDVLPTKTTTSTLELELLRIKTNL